MTFAWGAYYEPLWPDHARPAVPRTSHLHRTGLPTDTKPKRGRSVSASEAATAEGRPTHKLGPALSGGQDSPRVVQQRWPSSTGGYFLALSWPTPCECRLGRFRVEYSRPRSGNHRRVRGFVAQLGCRSARSAPTTSGVSTPVQGGWKSGRARELPVAAVKSAAGVDPDEVRGRSRPRTR